MAFPDIFPAFCLLLCPGLFAWAQTSTGTVKGNDSTRWSGANQFPNRTIHLQYFPIPACSETNQTAWSTIYGVFEFPLVPAREPYTISVATQGFPRETVKEFHFQAS